MTDQVSRGRFLVGSRRWISAIGLLVLLTLSKSSAGSHPISHSPRLPPKVRGGGGDMLSSLSSSSTTTTSTPMSRETRQIWNHHLQNKQVMPPMMSLESRFVNDEAKVIAMQPSSSSSSSSYSSLSSTENHLVPWKERKSLSHVAATCLTIGLVGLLVYDRLYFNHSTSLIVWYLVLVIAYLGEASFCSTRRYLSNILSPLQVLDTVQTLVSTRPVVTWTLKCYHYNQNRHHYNSNKGHGNDSTKADKVVTFRASRAFEYSEYVVAFDYCWGEKLHEKQKWEAL
jgi:hypothetical protein